MERRDFFKRLGFAGAAVVVAPQILAEIQSEANLIVGEKKDYALDMNIVERYSNGGIYLGDDLVFKIYDWSLEMGREFYDISRDPRYATPENPVPLWKEYEPGPKSCTLNGSGCMVSDAIPWDTPGPLKLVLFNRDYLLEAEGHISALSYGGEFWIDADITFHILGQVTQRFAE